MTDDQLLLSALLLRTHMVSHEFISEYKEFEETIPHHKDPEYDTRPTTVTYADSTHQHDKFQGKTVEQDHGLPKTEQSKVTSELGYTAEDEQSYYGRYQSALTTADTGAGRETLNSGVVPSMTHGFGTCDQSRTMVNTAPSFGDQGPEGNEQNELPMDTFSSDWNSKEIVATFTDHHAWEHSTPLHQAVQNGNFTTVKVLLEEGCSVDAVNNDGKTALHLAAQEGHVGIISEILRRNCPIDIRDKNGYTPLHDAASHGQTEAVVELIKNGAVKDVVAGKYGTPIHLAVISGHLETVKTLLDEGCSVLAVDDNGETALHWAADKGHVEIIRVLLSRNCPIDIRDKSGHTALHHAAACGQTETVVELIKNGADKDAVAVEYGTPFHQAVSKGHLETVKALLDEGCSVEAVDNDGKTALHWAAYGGSTIHPKHANIEIVRTLLQYGSESFINQATDDGRTPLHIAATHGNVDVAVELIRWGASKDVKATFGGHKGVTPLHVAGIYGHFNLFVQLLDEGCSMNQLDYRYFATLDKKHPPEYCDKLEKVLLKRGYKMDISHKSFFQRFSARQKMRSLERKKQKLDIQETPTWIQSYHRALWSHGYICVNIIRCVLVGPPKVGKSCLKHLLVHNQSKEIEHSTPVMESPDVVTFNREMYLASAQSSTSAWEYVSDEGMGAILRGWTENEEYLSTESYPRSTVASETSSSIVQSKSHPASNSHSVLTRQNTSTEGQGRERIDASPRALLWKMKVAHCHFVSQLKDYETKSNHKQDSLQQVTFISMIDSGGQPAFMDTLPLLLGTPCTYIHVFNASKDVDSLAEITYRDTDGREKVIASTETTWELMLRSLSSVQTLEYKCSEHLKDVMEDGIPVSPCRIAVVGTFKDELLKSPDHEDMVAGLNLRLKVFNELAHSSQPLMRDEENDQYLFLVDNLMYKDSEHEKKDSQYINSFRKAISSEDAALKLKIPLMWLMMELVTRKSGVKYIPYRDLKTFSLDHGYIDDNEDTDDQFRALLMLFHNLGFYAYYELEGVERENNLVCTEATVLFKEISKLLLIHFITPKSPAAKQFQEKGEILLKDEEYKELFSEIGVDSNIDSEWFLKVIHHLGLSAKLSYSSFVLGEESETISSYFIPLALPCGRANPPVKSTVAKLCFALKCWEDLSHTYRLPHVIFPRLIVLLANDWNSWELDLPNSDRTTVKFVHKGSFVYISERATLIEVNLLVPKEAFLNCGSTFKPSEADVKELHILCDSIRDDLTKAITTACTESFGDSFTKAANVVCGSLCSLCGAEVPHVATPSGGPGKSLMCPGKKQLFPMTSEQQIWLSDIDHSTVQVSLVEDISSLEPFWVLGLSNSASTGSASFDQRSFMEKYKDRFMEYVPAKAVSLVWEIHNIIDRDTCEEIRRALPSGETALLYLHIRDNSSLTSIRKLCDLLIKAGEDGYPHVKKLGEDMKEELEQLPTKDTDSNPCESDLMELVCDHTHSKWKDFGIRLGISSNLCEGIRKQKLGDSKECFILLCSKWLSCGAGTGDKPRTWRTVLEAVRECGFFEVADQVEQSFSKNPVLSSKPDLKDLTDLISGELGPKWSQLGRPLSIDESIIAAIQASSDVDCFVDMMRMWLDGREGSGSRPRTWDTVLSGLVEIGNGNLAGQVERRLVAKSSQC